MRAKLHVKPHAECGPVSPGLAAGHSRRDAADGSVPGAVHAVVQQESREGVIRWWFRRIARSFGVKIEVHGAQILRDYAEADRGALVMSNHISWLDIVAVNAVQPMRAQAKKELAGWPIIGRLASSAGTVYLDRENLRSLPLAVDELHEGTARWFDSERLARGHHLVRPGQRPVPPGDVPGRHRRSTCR